MRYGSWLVFLVGPVCSTFAAAGSSPPPLPPVDYSTIEGVLDGAGVSAGIWQPMAGSPAPVPMKAGSFEALRFSCPFEGTRIDRGSWDVSVRLDLALSSGLRLLMYCSDPAPVSEFTLYLHSGEGWYRVPFLVEGTTGWSPVTLLKKNATVEGRPGGWGRIDTLRFSAWRGRDRNTEFYLAALGSMDEAGDLVILRADSVAAKNDAELKTVKRYTQTMAAMLERAGLDYIVLSDRDLSAKYLKKIRLIILPYNPDLPEKVTGELAGYLKSGGKLLACYLLPRTLQPLVGIEVGAHIKQKRPGHFAALRPSAPALPGMPASTGQGSWNIHHARSLDDRARIAAWWFDDGGNTTGEPAVLISDNGAFLTHVLMDDDPENKSQFLLALLGELRPDLWVRVARQNIDRIARFDSYRDFPTACARILAHSSSSTTKRFITQARQHYQQTRKYLAEKNYPAAIQSARQSRHTLIDAYCAAQPAPAGEHRAFWCHSAFGLNGRTWDQAIKHLADNGFTAILPNMLWGGVAFYHSKVLPVASEVEQQGDQIEQCLTACRKYGVECHVWKVNYNMGWRSPREFMRKMKDAGRTQVNFNGRAQDRWLCPSHPENQTLEIESMLEVARNYKVHGVHFDYIRYPGIDACYCAGCRERFEKDLGRKVKKWPADLRSEADLQQQWLNFRRRQIDTVVEAVATRARRIRPSVKISAAVFRNWPLNRDSIGQDWKLWCERGWLDFVCPMDYTTSNTRFRREIVNQLEWASGVPCYPGIGLSTWSDRTDIVKVIEQMNITRELKTGGFTIFNYSLTEADHILPRLGPALTRP